MKIAFILYNGFSTFDFASLYEPLGKLKTIGAIPDLLWELCAAQESVLDTQGMALKPTQVGQPLNGYDLVVLPGGDLTPQTRSDSYLLDWLRSAGETPWLAAVGQGSVLLAAAGVLQGKKVAANDDTMEILLEYGAIPVDSDLAEEDAIFTASGSTAALKLGISLCAQLAGLGAAEQVREILSSKTETTLPVELASEGPQQSGEGPRYSRVNRKTNETEIELELDLDGSGQHQVDTGLPFLDHMLEQVAAHGLFDLKLTAQGDLQIDPHHTVEDIALALGEAFRLALGERRGIVRMASVICPMDDSLAEVTVDFSGRPYAVIQTAWEAPQQGGIPTSLFTHFMESFASQARCNLHAQIAYGKDDHHKAEALFKAFGRALDAATQIDERRGSQVPSTKGVLF
jgi:imidazoleglycerol-phosphate dehydratase